MKKISKRYYFLIGSLIFGMFFGAGNLIFPIHLGQLAGANLGKSSNRLPSFGRFASFAFAFGKKSASRVQTAFMILQNLLVQNMH